MHACNFFYYVDTHMFAFIVLALSCVQGQYLHSLLNDGKGEICIKVPKTCPATEILYVTIYMCVCTRSSVYSNIYCELKEMKQLNWNYCCTNPLLTVMYQITSCSDIHFSPINSQATYTWSCDICLNSFSAVSAFCCILHCLFINNTAGVGCW